MEKVLSARGESLLNKAPFPEYLYEHFKRKSHPDYVCLAIAENALMFDLLQPKLANRALLPSDLAYGDQQGLPELRSAIADLMTDFINCPSPVNPDDLLLFNGCGSAITALFWTICGPGDYVMIPSPYYAGFDPDVDMLPKVNVVEVPCHPSTGFALTVAGLEQAYSEAVASGKNIRALLLCSPQNPLGKVYSPDELSEIKNWALSKPIHLVCDEIYALSVFGDSSFHSMGALYPEMEQWVHVLWGLSKDFAMSGARVGVLLTQNELVKRATLLTGYYFLISGDSSRALASLLSDKEFVTVYKKSLKERLHESYSFVASSLSKSEIPFYKADGGIFVWADFSSCLEERTFEAESKLWLDLLNKSNVNLTPGKAFHSRHPGWFRICYASTPLSKLQECIPRLLDSVKRRLL